jgi:hypothetical protein
MFVRKKPNKTGVISVQIIDKSSGKYRLIETVGSSSDASVIATLCRDARHQITELSGEASLNFDIEKDKTILDLFVNGINEIRLVGPNYY